MRNRFFLLFLLTLCLGIGLVAAQDDPNDVPMPNPTPIIYETLDIQPEDLPFPATSTPVVIPTTSTSTVEPEECITGKDGQTYCLYPTMETCITGADGQTYCNYPTIIPTPTVQRPTLTPDTSRVSPGFWRETRASATIIGTCSATGVAHNPEGGGGAEPTLENPLVPIYQSNAGDFLFVDELPYALLQPRIYGISSTSRELGMTLSGATTAVKTTNAIQYEVVSSSLITVHRSYSEEGGCSINYDSKYELVRTDSSVAVVVVQDSQTAQATPTPVATQITTEQPPIPPGTYPVVWTIDSGTCTAKTQPAFTQAQISYANNGDMLLRLGDDEHTLFALGSMDNPRYQLVSSKYQITVQVLSGVIKMDWSKFASVTEMCFKSGELSTSSVPVATPAPFIDPTATPITATNSQHYQISFNPDEQMCPAAIREKLPAFDGATFEKLPDGGYQMVIGSETYVFKDNSGYSVYDGSDLKKGITYQITAFLVNQSGQLGLTYMDASGAFCLAEMPLSAK